MRLGLLLKMLEALDSVNGKEEAWKLATQRDQKGQTYDVSHYCHCRPDQFCVEMSHFSMEFWVSFDLLNEIVTTFLQ